MPTATRRKRRANRLKIALIGAGQMGSSHARIVAASDAADLAIVVDADGAAAQRLADRSWSRYSSDLERAFEADAVIVAAATAAHLACALPFLERGIPTFVEKPLAPNLAEVDRLLAASEATDTPLMCGFVERFNPALRTAVALVTEAPSHVLTVRHSPPAPRIASSVVSDMLLHDLDVIVGLFGAPVTSITSALHRPPTSGFAEIADCVITFEAGLANLSANRMGQRKVRNLTIHAGGSMIEVDLLRQDVTIYRHMSQEMASGVGGMGYRSSTDIDIPFVRHTGEPLSLQFEHFLELVDGAGDFEDERRRIRPPHELIERIEPSSAPDSAETTHSTSTS